MQFYTKCQYVKFCQINLNLTKEINGGCPSVNDSVILDFIRLIEPVVGDCPGLYARLRCMVVVRVHLTE